MNGEQAAGDPLVSVVIASHDAGPVLTECLAALEALPGREDCEVIVADSSTDDTAQLVRTRFPRVRVLSNSTPLTIPQLRGFGIAAARGSIVAILDPYCIVDGNWLQELRRVHVESRATVVGGAVELDSPPDQPLTAWAVYLNEYGAFMPPMRPGPTGVLTGNNIAYKRAALGPAEDLAARGFWKAFANRSLEAEGQVLCADPALIVRLRKSIPFGEFLGSRYHHGRCFAAMRVADAPRFERLLRAATVPLLPLVALWRQARVVYPKHRRRGTFVMTLPLQLLLQANWAWGELWGYLRGPGTSCTRLFY